MQLAKALRDAGVKTAEERLRDIAISVRAKNPNWDQAKAALFASIRHDASLLETLFEPDRSQRLHLYLTKIDAEIRAASPAGRGHFPIDDHFASAPASRTNARETAQGGGRTICGNQQGGAPSRPSTAGMAAVANIARLSLLDTLKIEGRAIGEWGVGEARTWARRTGINVRFVEMLTANLPLEDTIGRWIKADEADEIWKRAQETQNAA